MTGKRIFKTVVNLLLVLVLLLGLWGSVGLPLPWKWQYRRAERAMLLEPMEILWHGEDGAVLSVDEEQLCLYTGRFFGYPMFTNEMHLFPLENGAGRAVRKETFFRLDIMAYEASGQAVRAELQLRLYRADDADVLEEDIQLTAHRQDDLFWFYVEPDSMHGWQEDALQDLVCLDVDVEPEYESSYAMTITFYDEAGSVTATHESGGSYNEN